jgi:hypothetical protein
VTPKLRPLLYALIELGLAAVRDGNGSGIKIQVTNPDQSPEPNLVDLFANTYAPGAMPKGGGQGVKVGQGLSATKVGDSIVINRSAPDE